MRIVPQTKCVRVAPRSGLARAANASACDGGAPPSHVYTVPAALTVITIEAMLKSVQWVVERRSVLNVH